MRTRHLQFHAFVLLLASWPFMSGGADCEVSLPGATGLTWTIDPQEQTVAPGAEAVFTLTIQTKTDINSEIAFAMESLPPGWTATFDPPTLPDTGTTSTLRVQPAAGAEEGVYHFNVVTQEVGVTGFSIQARVTIVEDDGSPDFTLEVTPIEHDFGTTASQSPTITYYIRPRNGFVGTVSISVSGVVSPIVITQEPIPPQIVIDGGGQGGTFVVRREQLTSFEIPVVVTATSGQLSHQRTVTVRGSAPVTAPTGACCNHGLCSARTQTQCTAEGGTYQGDNSGCAPGTCGGTDTGACCVGPENCIQTTSTHCQNLDGSFRGVGTSCSPNPCLPGS
jgi:hypothetical protein